MRIGEPFQPGGQTAWVAPASGTDHDLVVKIAWRHPEAAHEADGLRIWDGNGAVRLHAVEEIDGSTLALLLERCRPGTTLETLPEPEQDLIIAGLLHRFWRQPPADGPFRPAARARPACRRRLLCRLPGHRRDRNQLGLRTCGKGGGTGPGGIIRPLRTHSRPLPPSIEEPVEC